MKTAPLKQPLPPVAATPDPPEAPPDTDGAWSKPIDEVRFLTDPSTALQVLNQCENGPGE